MSDWTDEVRARMVREEERLRYKAANLQARGKTVMAAQELVVADDIRAALEEIERLGRVVDASPSLTGLAQLYREQDRLMDDVQSTGKLWHEAEQRAQAAEAKLAEAMTFIMELNRLDGDEADGVAEILANPKFWATEYAHAMGKLASVMEVEERAKRAEAEVERLRRLLERAEPVTTRRLAQDIRAALRGGGK